MAHTLYRFFGSPGSQLLYVGITVRPWDRWRQHRREKPWWSEVTSVTMEHFDTLDEVREAELAAIRNEHPRYNISGRREKPEEHAPVMQHFFMTQEDRRLIYACSCTEDAMKQVLEELKEVREVPLVKGRPEVGTRSEVGYEVAYEECFRQGLLMYADQYAAHVVKAVLGERFNATRLGSS